MNNEKRIKLANQLSIAFPCISAKAFDLILEDYFEDYNLVILENIKSELHSGNPKRNVSKKQQTQWEKQREDAQKSKRVK